MRKNLAIVLFSLLCLSQVGCTPGGGLELSNATPMYYNYDDPYYSVNPGYYWGGPVPYYHNDDYNTGYYGGYYYRR